MWFNNKNFPFYGIAEYFYAINYFIKVLFLTHTQVSQETRKVVWFFYLFQNSPQFVVKHTIKAFCIVNEQIFFFFLAFPCFLYDPTNVGNLISGSSAFSKSSFKVWRFLVHILLKPSLGDFDQNLISLWNEDNCMVVWTFFSIALLWDCGHCWIFQTCWHIEYNILTASSFRIWNSSAGFPSLPLALFVLMLLKAHLNSYSRMSDLLWVITPSCLSRSLRAFLYRSSVYSCHLFLISYASVRSLPFISLIMPILTWNILFSVFL